MIETRTHFRRRPTAAAGTARPNAAVHTVLADFEPLQPTAPIAQTRLVQIVAGLMALSQLRAQNIALGSPQAAAVVADINTQLQRYSVSPTIISARQINVLHQLSSLPPAELRGIEQLEQATSDYDPSAIPLHDRMVLYGQLVWQVLDQAYRETVQPPDDIIHVSCSGYLSPNPVERLVSDKQWTATTVTNSYHMGCYGSVPALRMAGGFIAASAHSPAGPKRQVDIVHSEYLSLHFDLSRITVQNAILTSLFGDGLIKYSAVPLAEARRRKLSGLKLLATKEALLPNSLADMSWNLSATSFAMTLSKKVPFVLRDHVHAFVEQTMAAAGLDYAREKQRLVFAIHPGGPKIVDFLQRQLQLEDEQVEVSREILYRFGNMSSATLPYMWSELIARDSIPTGTLIFSLAFGPGLTAAAAVFVKV